MKILGKIIGFIFGIIISFAFLPFAFLGGILSGIFGDDPDKTLDKKYKQAVIDKEKRLKKKWR